MQPPPHVTNIPHWEELCRKIRARALDLLEGRAGVIVTSRELQPLAFRARLADDPDLLTFRVICSETDALPAGPERQYWAAHALEREDKMIRRAEDFYRDAALEAARNLAARFEWALEARIKRRTGDAG